MPENKHPQEVTGWNFMLLGFALLVIAGIALYAMPDADPRYHKAGSYLTGIGFAVYITGRIIRSRGRRLREKGEKK